MKLIPYPLILIGLMIGCVDSKTESNTPLITQNSDSATNQVILSADLVWEQLNPARGAQSPQAATIWGDRKGEVSTGFLAKFTDGFSSPPHIHNVTYRAVVIKGLIHNDDPEAKNMWMKPGSFWTQPEGESHITSAQGKENIALVEIDKGPYLVKPIDDAYDNGEKPINIDASNIVWLKHHQTNWVDSVSHAEISFLLENKTSGTKSLFIKLPVGYKGNLETDGTILHAVLIDGELKYKMPQNNEIKTLDEGSYFTATNRTVHHITNAHESEAILYLRTNGTVKVN